MQELSRRIEMFCILNGILVTYTYVCTCQSPPTIHLRSMNFTISNYNSIKIYSCPAVLKSNYK